MILTVEIRDFLKPEEAEAAICFDEEGLDCFISMLLRLKGKRDHEHLMTPSWGGNGLTEDPQGGPGYQLVNHLRLVKF